MRGKQAGEKETKKRECFRRQMNANSRRRLPTRYQQPTHQQANLVSRLPPPRRAEHERNILWDRGYSNRQAMLQLHVSVSLNTRKLLASSPFLQMNDRGEQEMRLVPPPSTSVAIPHGSHVAVPPAYSPSMDVRNDAALARALAAHEARLKPSTPPPSYDQVASAFFVQNYL